MWLPVRERFQRAASPNLVLAVVCLGIFVAALDQTVIYGAMPDIMTDIGLPITKLDQASWIVIGYLLGYTLAMPLMGWASDLYGHVRIYIICLLIFMVGSVFVALAGNFQWMVGARVVQAVGGGAIVPIAMAMVGDLLYGKRAVALGIIGATVEAGGALGPFYGAAVAQFWGWQWIFWLNLPINFAVILVILLFLRPNLRPRFKMLPVPRVSTPPFELSMFKNATFSAANVTNLFVGGALIIAMVNVPLMSDTIMGLSPLEGGLRLLRFTISLSVGAVTGGFLCKRFGYRLPTILGLVLSSVGFIFMSRWTLAISDPQLTIHLVVGGFGFGLVIAPLSTAVIDSVRNEQRGTASSVVVMARMMGMIGGLAVITSWGMGRFHLMTAGMSVTEIVAAPEQLNEPLLALFHDFYRASVGICLAAVIPALWLGRKKKPAIAKTDIP